MLNDSNNALKHIDVVVNEMNPLNGKCEYIKALIYLKFGDPIGASVFKDLETVDIAKLKTHLISIVLIYSHQINLLKFKIF